LDIELDLEERVTAGSSRERLAYRGVGELGQILLVLFCFGRLLAGLGTFLLIFG